MAIGRNWQAVHCGRWPSPIRDTPLEQRLTQILAMTFKCYSFFKLHGEVVEEVVPTEKQFLNVLMPLMHRPESIAMTYYKLFPYYLEELGEDVLLALGCDQRPLTLTCHVLCL